jgi:hypothetical protein
MNCQPIRNRILAVEDLAQLPGELTAHLDECAACRSWRRKVVSVEQVLAQLPVPESDGLAKKAVLARIRDQSGAARDADFSPVAIAPATTPAPLEFTPILPEPSANHRSTNPSSFAIKPLASALNLADDLPPKKYSVGRIAAKFWPAGLMAATLLLGTIAWLSLRGNKAPTPVATPRDPLLDSLVRLNVDLADPKKQTAAERVQILALVAEDLNNEMRDIARADASGENMRDLEKMYRKVVLDGLVAQARLVDRSQREVVLGKIAASLARAGQNAENTAKESPQHSAESLRDAADAAHEGTKQINRLIQEAS